MYKNNINKNYPAYLLGLVGSILSFIVCFIIGLLVFVFHNLFVSIFGEFFDDIFGEIFYMYQFQGLDGVYNGVYQIGVIMFVIILVGAILGLIGTLLSWRRLSIFSCIIMIIGGFLSLVSLIFPGLFLIFGGILNFKTLNDNIKANGRQNYLGRCYDEKS